jgi:hypothetical protein
MLSCALAQSIFLKLPDGENPDFTKPQSIARLRIYKPPFPAILAA